VIRTEHVPVGKRFATRGADKFADADFRVDENCVEHAKPPGGDDHTLLLGRVRGADVVGGNPVVYLRRAFHTPKSLEESER
jgi:flavin reductase ActVB